MMRRSRFLALLPFLAALACSSLTEPGGAVAARATVLGIEATNLTDRPIFYIAVERNALALADFALCTDAARCETIAPGVRRTIPWGQVAFYSADAKEYVLLWWHAPAGDEMPVPGSVVVTR